MPKAPASEGPAMNLLIIATIGLAAIVVTIAIKEAVFCAIAWYRKRELP